MPLYCRIFLFLNLVYCCVGLVTKRVPAWRMFDQVDPLQFQLRDSSGALIEILGGTHQPVWNHHKTITAVAGGEFLGI